MSKVEIGAVYHSHADDLPVFVLNGFIATYSNQTLLHRDTTPFGKSSL